MKPTKKQLKEILEVEKKVANVCDTNDVIIDEITGIIYPKKEINPSTSINEEITITLSFGTSSPSIKKQLKNQGFEIFNEYVKNAEQIRFDLHSLNKAGILKEKYLLKCFERLSKKISKKVIESILKQGEVATHIETKIV